MSNWASSYRRRKADRQTKTKPEWVTNPETGEKFCLRRTGAMPVALSGSLPADLTSDAIASWKDAGVEVDTESKGATPSALQQDEGDRQLRAMARVIAQACVVPVVIASKENVNAALDALQQADSTFDRNTFDANELVIDISELEQSDALFIFSYATGANDRVMLEGGQVANVTDIKSLAKKPGRISRVGPDGGKVRQAS